MLDEIFKFIQSTRQPGVTTVIPKALNHITQCQIQRPLENLRGWQVHHLGNQFQCLITRTAKKKFLILDLNLHYSSLRPFALSLSPGTVEKTGPHLITSSRQGL